MKTRTFVLILLLEVILTSWIFKDSFPDKKVIETFESLVSSESELASITISSYDLMTDTNFQRLLPNTSFFSVTIKNPSHWEYNLGHINVISAISGNETDIRLLLPVDYAESSTNFFDLFYYKDVSHLESTCVSITNLLFKTYNRQAFNCKENIEDFKQIVTQANQQLTVETSWTETCRDLESSSQDSNQVLVSKKTVFSLDERRITFINLEDWKK